MPAIKRIKIVAFDYGNVIASGGNVFEILYQELGAEYGFDWKEKWQGYREALNEWEKSKISEKEFWQRVSKVTGVEGGLPLRRCAQFWLTRVIELIQPEPAMYRLAERLKKKGAAVAILSNVTPPHAYYERAVGHYDGFKPVVLSTEARCRKPEPEIFDALAKAAGLPIEACALIDDRSHNVEAIEKLGGIGIKFELHKDSLAWLEKELGRVIA